MWEHADTAAAHGLRYLSFISAHGHPSIDGFEAYLEHPRPARKSLTEVVQASREPSGKDTGEWMQSIGWIVVDGGTVRLSELGWAVLAAMGDPVTVDDDVSDGERSDSEMDEAFEAIVAEESESFVEE